MGKIILRVLGTIAAIILGIVVIIAGVVFYDTQIRGRASDITSETIPAEDGTPLAAYIARPDEGEGPFPGVVMIHEFWGLNTAVAEMADLLANEGYVVVVVDTYRGQTASMIPGGIFLAASTDDARADRDVKAAYDWLAAQPDVDAERIGGIGFCYGGGVIFRQMLQNPGLRAVVNLYGDTAATPDQLANLKKNEQIILGIFGAEDGSIPPETVSAFETALYDAEVMHRITVYSGVGHAFVQPAAIRMPGQARNAWLEIRDFFKETLQQ